MIGDEPYATEHAIVVFVGLVAVCILASVVGYVMPWPAQKFGFDPAVASDPLTAIKDVTALDLRRPGDVVGLLVNRLIVVRLDRSQRPRLDHRDERVIFDLEWALDPFAPPGGFVGRKNDLGRVERVPRTQL